MKKVLIASTILLIGLTFLLLWVEQQQKALQPTSGAQGEAAVGGDFALTDQSGKTVKDADFRGRIMMVFFGFTHCPDICPVTVSSLSKMMEMLGDQADQVAPIFITVDAKRDTPDVMKSYLSSFDSRIVGLTGSPEDIEKVTQAYKAYYSESKHSHDDSDGHGEHGGHDAANYAVDHSGFIYLMDKNGKYVKHFAYDAKPTDLADAIKAELK